MAECAADSSGNPVNVAGAANREIAEWRPG